MSDDTTRPASQSAGFPTGVRFGPPAAAGEIGRFGKYRVQKLLGKGGMGEVYLAFDEWLRRPVALKLLIPDQRDAAGAAERFLREARAAARITSDHVVAVFEAAEIDGVPYITMPLLKGYPLDQFLKRKGEPDLRQTVRLAREVALGLQAAHELDVVHRDIKPGNIWLEAPDGRAKVVDFGLAKPIAGSGRGGSLAELTETGMVVGTPAYMSPEQAHGEKVDHRTDLFSLGAVMYRLVVGKTPFDRGSALGTLAAIVSEEPTAVRELNPSVPPALADLIRRLMAKNPAGRPATARAVADELTAIESALPAAGAPVAALSVSGGDVNPFAFADTEVAPAPDERTEREYEPPAPARRGMMWAAVAAVAVAAIAVGAAVFALSGPRAKPTEAAREEPKPVPAPRPDSPRKTPSSEKIYDELTGAAVRQQLTATPPARDRKLPFGTPDGQAVIYRTAVGGVGKLHAVRDGENVSVKYETQAADGTPVRGAVKLTPYQALDLDTGDAGPTKPGSDLWWVIPATGVAFVDFRQSGAAVVAHPFAAVPEVLYQPRNPFGLKDIFEPDQPAALQLGKDAKPDEMSSNANWKFKGTFQRKEGIDGEWASRWKNDTKKGPGWSIGTATITTVGDRVFANFYDGARYLIEWKREGNRLVGVYQQADGVLNGTPITAFVMGDDRIDGVWGEGGYARWDFRR